MAEPKTSAAAAGYMELPGARKDAECRKVQVSGGVARELGCCNFFEWDDGRPKRFNCGNCEYVQPRGIAAALKARAAA